VEISLHIAGASARRGGLLGGYARLRYLLGASRRARV